MLLFFFASSDLCCVGMFCFPCERAFIVKLVATFVSFMLGKWLVNYYYFFC